MAHSSTMEKLGSPAPGFYLQNFNTGCSDNMVSLETFKNFMLNTVKSNENTVIISNSTTKRTYT